MNEVMIVKYGIKADKTADTVIEGEVLGNVVSVSLDIDIPESLGAMRAELTDAGVYALALRQYKADAGNAERARLQAVNGHSTVKLMTAEDKAKSKIKRLEDKALLQAIKAQGLTLADIENRS